MSLKKKNKKRREEKKKCTNCFETEVDAALCSCSVYSTNATRFQFNGKNNRISEEEKKKHKKHRIMVLLTYIRSEHNIEQEHEATASNYKIYNSEFKTTIWDS